MTKRVAVIGASHDRHKFGNKAVRAFAHQGYEVIPINPAAREIEGLRAYASILDVPGPVDMATIYVPPDVGLQLIDQIASKGVREVWLNPGSESPALVARARRLGLDPVLACSVLAIGERPESF